MSDDDRTRLVRALTTAGWLFFLAYVAMLISVIRRAASVRQGSFEDGLWGQRIELVSFVTLPPNLVVLAPATAAAVAAGWLVTDPLERRQRWVAQLVRAIAGVSAVNIVIGALGLLDVFWQTPDPVGGTQAILLRVGGILMSAATIRLCAEVESRS